MLGDADRPGRSPVTVLRGNMSDRIDRRSFLARGAATGAGIAAIGTSGGLLAACSSRLGLGLGLGTAAASSHPDGISTATPKLGGSSSSASRPRRRGSAPPRAPSTSTGILYARTVFDPLTIIGADGTVQPYLAAVGHPERRLHGVDDHHAAQPGLPQRHPVRRAAVAANFAAPAGLGPHRSGRDHHRRRQRDQPPGRHRDHEVAVGALRLLPGRRHRGPDRLHRRAQLAEVQQPDQSHRHRALRVPGLDPERPLHRHQEPPLLAPGLPYLDSITYKPIPDTDQLLASLQSGGVDIMHTSTRAR